MGIGIGFAVMIGLWLWVFMDLFSIQAWVAEHNQQLEAQASAAVAAAAPAPLVPKKSLESRLIKAAQEWGNELTLNRVVALTFGSFEDVEACLKRMVEAGHVDVDNRPGSGVIVYKVWGVMNKERKQKESVDGSPASAAAFDVQAVNPRHKGAMMSDVALALLCPKNPKVVAMIEARRDEFEDC